MNPAEADFHIRPRFKIQVDQTIDEIQAQIKMALEDEDATCQGKFIRGHGTLYLPAEERHFWSPELNLNLEEAEKGTVIRGLYGPRPQIWTMFFLFYSVIGLAVLILSVFGASYYMLGKSAQILWAVPILLLIFLSLYLIAYFGQRLGRQQMNVLHDFFESCLERKTNKPTSVA